VGNVENVDIRVIGTPATRWLPAALLRRRGKRIHDVGAEAALL
jgi:hypothetical protein